MDLRREKLEGDLGEEGLEKWNNLGLFVLLFFLGFEEETLHWSFGLLGTEEVGVVVVAAVVVVVVVVRQRRLELETG